MGDLGDATLSMELLRLRVLDTCATPRHNWRSASWCKRPNSPSHSSPIPESSSSNGEEGNDSFVLFDDTGVKTQSRKPNSPSLPSPIPESSSRNREEGYDKFGLFLDAEEDNKEQEVSCTRPPRFFDSQGRYMQLLCPPFRALSFSGFSHKETMSREPAMNTLPKRALDTRNETQTKIDLNFVQDVVYDEEHQGGGNDIIEENGQMEESKDRAAQCDKECSQVLPYLFVGSRTVAQKLSTLHHCGITHILNCVGFACIENFPNDFCYRTLWLEDSPGEDLTCILYDVFDFIEEVREQEDCRLFLHCCQGISRSVALVIAYLMWKEHRSFDDAYAFVKAARCIASPNIGFVVQLLQWQSKIQNPPSENVFRMYCVVPHSSYAPLHLVAKTVPNPSICSLDSRGVFIIQLSSKLYIWRGKRSDLEMVAAADRSAFQLVRYEHVQGPLVSCNEGFEPAELCEALGTGNVEVKNSKSKLGEISLSFEVGEKIVAEYDTDYQLFWTAKLGGFMPPAVGTGLIITLPAKAECFCWFGSTYNCGCKRP